MKFDKHAVDDILNRPNYFYICLFANISAKITLLPDNFYQNILYKNTWTIRATSLPVLKVRAIKGFPVLN